MSEKLLSVDPAEVPAMTRVVLLDSVGSTNEYARDALMSTDSAQRRSWGELSVVSTADQRSGKGRLNRVWTAPRGAALATSFMIRPHVHGSHRLDTDSYHWLTLLLALAAVDTFSELGIRADIKWPNDVLVNQKKVCGILAQLIAEPDGQLSVVAGIGMNLNFSAEQLPVETATSALVERGEPVDLSVALRSLVKNFAHRYKSFTEVRGDANAIQSDGQSLLDSIRGSMSTLGKQVKVHLPGEQVFVGQAIDINDDGEILVRASDQEVRSFAVGDVVHLRSQ